MSKKKETKVYRSVGSSVEAQLAHRVGETACFVRYRERDPRYGYKWTPWRSTTIQPYLKSNGDDPASWSETESGWSEIQGNYKPNVRLPR
jgi:hypothetical protein